MTEPQKLTEPGSKASLPSLFISFFYIGLFTFGGGMAMLPMLQKEIVEKHRWCTEEDILDYFAVGQCTPGIIAVNTATFVGEKTRGLLGALFATLGVVFPSLIIITILSSILKAFSSNVYVSRAFSGIRVVVSALILNSLIKLLKSAKPDVFFFILMLVSFGLKVLFDISSVLIIIASIALGLLYFLINRKKEPRA